MVTTHLKIGFRHETVCCENFRVLTDLICFCVCVCLSGALPWQQPPVVQERSTQTSLTFNVPPTPYNEATQPYQRYTFSYRRVFGDLTTGQWMEDLTGIEAGTPTYTLVGLQPGSMYDVRFRGQTATTNTPYSAAVRVETPSLGGFRVMFHWPLARLLNST